MKRFTKNFRLPKNQAPALRLTGVSARAGKRLVVGPGLPVLGLFGGKLAVNLEQAFP
jgi:hypothetical protein